VIGLSRILAPVRGLGRERLSLLASVTGGHAVIHWFQQIFPIMIPAITDEFGLSGIQVGYVGAARQVGNALTLPSGILADSFVRHRAIMLGSAIAFMGVAYLLIGIAPSFIWILPGAMFVGLGTATWHPPAMASLSSRFPDSRATALSIHGVGATFGDTLTPLAVGGLLVIFHWRGVLQIQIVVALVAALLVWRSLAHQFSDTGPKPSRAERFRDVKLLARNPVFVGVSSAQGLMNMSRNTVLLFLPLYIQRDLGFNAFELGLYIALLHGMGIVSQPILGILSDRFGRKEVLLPSYLILGGMYLLLSRAEPGWQLVVLVLAIGIFFYTLTNVTTAAVLDVAGTGIQASSMGMTSLFTQAISLPAPIFAGWLAGQAGYSATFVLAASFMFLGAAVLLPLRLYKGTHRTARFSG
jgi:FSR family fosmidomycin resistance protein-like MFS transporter